MKEWKALRNLVAVLVISAAMLLILWSLVQAGVTQIITPTADTVAVEFVKALAAHRYEGANNQLSEEIRQQVSESDLAEIVKRMEAAHQGVEQVEGQEPQEEGNRAMAPLKVKMSDGVEIEVTFPLQQEKQLWRITSIEPVKGLAGE